MKEKNAEGKESVHLGASVNMILVRGPLRFLNDTITQGRFLEGVVVSVMYFERYGIKKLEGYFKSKDIPVEPMKLEDISLSKIMSMLEGFGLIDHRTHSLMGEICTERNTIVHRIGSPDAIDEGKAKATIEKAIDCLKALGAS
jgi:hypothetical protein